MDSDVGKLFLGGISWETTEDKIRDHFKVYGEVAETVIMKDKITGRGRGFGFVVFADPAVADTALLEKHTIDGRTIDVKKAVPRDEQQNAPPRGNNAITGAGPRTKKIFVGGLASTVSEDDFRMYFEQFGKITDVVVMYDHDTQRPRGFGFITFDSEDAVDAVLQKAFHDLKGKMVEVKRAVPKELSIGTGRNTGAGGFGASAGRGGGTGGPYAQGYNTSPSGGSGARPDNRFGAPSVGRGSYTYGPPTYGSVPYASAGGYTTGVNGGAYGAPGYGVVPPYGAAGASGAYIGGYGGAPGGGGYAAGGGYSTSAPGGYGAGGRGGWGGGGAGYATATTAGYGTGGPAYGAEGGWGSAPGTVQPLGSTGSYSSGGYGYGSGEGGYGPNASGFSGRSGYGGSGASGYGDVYGNSGYGDGTAAGGATGGSYGIGSGAAATDGASNGTPGFVGSYGAPGRQPQRGVSDARFRPYPATNDRTS